MEEYYSEIDKLGLETRKVWDRSLDRAKLPIVEAVKELMSAGLNLTSSTGGCIPYSKRLLEALGPTFQDIEQVPFDWRPHAFLHQRKHGLIINSTYLQHFDVGQYQTLIDHHLALSTGKRAERSDRCEQISQSIGAVLVATKAEIIALFRANYEKIAINGILRCRHREEEESEPLAKRRYILPSAES